MKIMRKICFIILPVLAMFFYSSTAFAQSTKELPAVSSDNPLSAYSTGSDVNVRNMPGSDGEKLTTLYQNEEVCLLDKKNTGEEYPWVLVSTEWGDKGWVYGKFIAFNDDALTENGRFKAKFEYDVFFPMSNQKVFMHKAGIQNDKVKNAAIADGDPHYADTKMIFDKGFTFYLMDDAIIGVTVENKDYTIAGLKVGDTLDENRLKQFNAKMIATGWDEMGFFEEKNQYSWYLNQKVDGVERPVRRFSFVLENGVIKSFDWGNIVID